MDAKLPKRIAFVSSFPPRKCGIATFCADLIKSLRLAGGARFCPLVVALRTDPGERYEDPVSFEIRAQVRNDYLSAADYLNFSHVDLVSVQHEFGLFGGPAGSHLLHLLRRLKVPVVTTLHTVLDQPAPEYRRAFLEVCRHSDHLVTMNLRGVEMLEDLYGVERSRISLIPHGIPDLPFVDSSYYKHQFDLDGRRTILTFGLLGPNKGIETMLAALPRIVEADPTVIYLVIGMTHPNILKAEGERYRFGLQRQVQQLGLERHVRFYNRFLDDTELHNALCAADLYVTPYVHRQQLTSGTLAFAVGTGKAVVSTPYWAAEELLADGRGRLVPFADAPALADAIVEILQDRVLFDGLRRQAYDYGRERTWPRVGQMTWACYERLGNVRADDAASVAPRTTTTSRTELPEPRLDHLIRLTDDTGLLQHAEFTLPQRRHGYCTDDNARAVILMTRYCAQYPGGEAHRLFETYLSFILHAQRDDGTVRNFMGYDRHWRDPEPSHDALGRFLWALGSVMAHPPSREDLSLAKDHFDRSVAQIVHQSARGQAYAILGLCDYLRQFPGASRIKRHLETAADHLVTLYGNHRTTDWDWFEPILTYDNACLPHALFAASGVLHRADYLEVALQTCRFLLNVVLDGPCLSLVGCHGWFPRQGPRARFDQQPVDAASLVLMLRAAFDNTNDPETLRWQRQAFDWFLGHNDLHLPLIDFRTGGCADGLTSQGVNANQGAESTLSFLLSLLDVLDAATVLERPTRPTHGPIEIVTTSMGSASGRAACADPS